MNIELTGAISERMEHTRLERNDRCERRVRKSLLQGERAREPRLEARWLRRRFSPILRAIGIQRPWMRHIESHPRFMSVAMHEEPSKAAAGQGTVSRSDQNSLAVIEGSRRSRIRVDVYCSGDDPAGPEWEVRWREAQWFRERELEEVGGGQRGAHP